ncbi:MAG: EAL domain-containing protein, partial [Acidimicrobiales bacterium]|nr:EAL domain-containing protein [Acidimicrobiales bacterium]
LVALAVVGLVFAVSRPLRRLADAVEQIGQGRLDTELAEEGPVELRAGARALNSALASLRTAEAQATALAEERLDDPILGQRAPGTLGMSLQSAVSRLTESLNERENFERRLSHQARHDSLTRLANRGATLEHLEQAMQRSAKHHRPLAVMFIDIDDFKSVNDIHGHRAGDLMLSTIARRIVTAVRTSDLAGRLGGDEFVVIAEDVPNEQQALELGQRLLDEIAQPMTIDGTTHHPSVSIGVALAEGPFDPDEVLRDADLAVYRAKAEGKRRIDVCDDRLRREVEERAAVEHDLRAALDADQLVLHFQPTVEAETRTIRTVEALVRWQHPQRGLIQPVGFVPIAERSDLILDLDRWVVRSAAQQLAAWADHPLMADVSIAVNISARHLSHGVLAAEVADVLQATGARADRLIVELTETALFDDVTVAAAELQLLRDLGVRVALDDFGTGYMSVTQLRSLGFDSLKIDRSFVAEMSSSQNFPLIKLMVDIGHILGVEVIAEGIETEGQAALLTSLGSDHLQGFYFARPTSAAEVEAAVTLAHVSDNLPPSIRPADEPSPEPTGRGATVSR